MYGKIEPEYYEDPYLHDPRLLGLVNRVKVVPSDEADRTENEFNLCELEFVLKSGARKTQRVEYHRGHFEESDDGRGDGREVSPAGAKTSCRRSHRQLLKLLWESKRTAGQRADRGDAGVVLALPC